MPPQLYEQTQYCYDSHIETWQPTRRNERGIKATDMLLARAQVGPLFRHQKVALATLIMIQFKHCLLWC
jgi:hypothetical protein